MSDPVGQSYHGSDVMDGQSVPYASNHLSFHFDPKDRPSLNPPLVGADISDSAKGFRGVNEASTVKITDGSTATSSNSLRKEGLDCHTFPMFNLNENREIILGLRNDQSTICHRQVPRSQIEQNSDYKSISLGSSEHHLSSKSVWAPPETETSTRRCHSQAKCISRDLELPVKSKFLEKSSPSVSRPFMDHFMELTPNIMPPGFNSEKTPIQSFMRREVKDNKLKSVLASKEPFTDTSAHLEHEQSNYHSYSEFLVYEKKIDNHLKPRTSGTSLLRQKDGALLLYDSSTSNNCIPDLLGENYQRMQNHSGIRFFPSRSIPLEVTKSEKLYHARHSLQKMPCSVHDVQAFGLCTTVDSVEGTSRCPPKFSQTTHRFFIAEKTDVNFLEGGQMFKGSSVSTKFKGNAFNELLSLSPTSGFNGQQGLKLQPFDSSTDGHTKTFAVGLKNESSTETDTMDVDAFQGKNHISGLAFRSSNKDMEDQHLPSSQTTIASAREEVGGRLPNTDLPDMNEVLSALPAVASSVNDGEPSTSRTQSLDAEHLLSNVEQPTNSKPSHCSGGPLGPKPSSRWVKRLKLSASDSFGTRSLKMGDTSSHEKVNKLFHKIMKCSLTSSESQLGIHHSKELMSLDQTAKLSRKGQSSLIGSAEKDKDMMLSRSWIQRWCHNRAASPQKKPDAVVLCEPQSSKIAFNDLQKKQFPSIAAMALMGKVMNGFHPCEFRKRGSFVVWNTKV